MRRLVFIAAVAALLAIPVAAASPFPTATLDPTPATAGAQTAVFAGGCFWGVQGVFERLNGVSNTVAGFAGGSSLTAHYEVVSTGMTGHAESVQVTYDPAVISYGTLLKVFFAVIHDPTQLNRQGPDEGTQYRSSIFYATPEQKAVAEAYIQQLTDAHVFKHKIVTTVVPLQGFYAAEGYHQHFLDHNMSYPYIVYNDLPKIAALKKQYPELMTPSLAAKK